MRGPASDILIGAVTPAGLAAGDEEDLRFAAPTCRGRVATIVGTAKDDVIVGTRRDDVIVGGDGHGPHPGRGGNDIISGGPGPRGLEDGDDVRPWTAGVGTT